MPRAEWDRWYRALSPDDRAIVTLWLVDNPPPAEWTETPIAYAWTECPLAIARVYYRAGQGRMF